MVGAVRGLVVADVEVQATVGRDEDPFARDGAVPQRHRRDGGQPSQQDHDGGPPAAAGESQERGQRRQPEQHVRPVQRVDADRETHEREVAGAVRLQGASQPSAVRKGSSADWRSTTS